MRKITVDNYPVLLNCTLPLLSELWKKYINC